MTLLTLTQAAAQRGVSVRTIQRAVDSGLLPHVAISTRVRLVDKKHLERVPIRDVGRPKKVKP